MMYHLLYYFVCILLFGSTIFSSIIAQNLPESYYDEELKYYVCKGKIKDVNFLLDTLQYNTIKDTVLLACCYHQIGVHYFNEGDYIKSVAYNKLAIELRKQFDDGLLWKTNKNMGLCYKKLGKYKQAVNYLEAALDSYKKEDEYKLLMLKNLAYVLLETGENHRAENLLNQAIKLGIDGNMDRNEIARIYTKKAKTILNAMDSLKFNEAISYAQKGYEFSIKNKTEIAALTELGNAYNHNGDYNNAIIQYNKVLLKNKDTLYQSKILNNIGTVNQKLGKHEKSISVFNKALKLKLTYFKYQKYNYNYAVNYNNIAFNYYVMEQFDSSLVNNQKVLIHLTNNFRNEDISENPDPKDTSLYIYSYPNLIQALHLKAIVFYQYYQQNNNPKYLHLAHNAYQTLFKFHNNLQQNISTENSRLLQVKNILEYLEEALEIAYTKQLKNDFDAEATFRFMEKNKATVLLQSINEADALQFANLPDSLLGQEKDLKMNISFYERKLNEAKTKENAITVVGDLENTLFENKEKYHRLNKALEESYPNYYQLKYQQNKTTLSDVQKSLNSQTAVLEYFVGKNNIYILSIQKNFSKLYQIEKQENWEQTIDNLRKSITDIDNDHPKLFAKSAHYLYQLLLDGPLCDLQESITKLQIIPDAELNYIPFEILLTKDVDEDNIEYKKLSYLVNSKSIGYAYSAALLLENKQSATSQKDFAYCGYAPEYTNDNLYDLPIARQTVQNLANSLNGKAYVNQQANLSNFLNQAENYSILHLSMHGVLNDENPLSSYMVFSHSGNYKLFAYDLYNMKINSDLTILHACNTGTGELQKGEGVMSLSRAFTYAGCPSLVMSLWQIPEAATSEITKSFINNLKNGLTKDVALQQAKLKYLQNKPEREASPAYWAGLVATGNLNAIDF